MGEPSYGDVTGEYLALREEAALVGPAHDLLWVRGSGAVGFLDGLLSQHVAGVPAGGVGRSFLLEPRGKVTALLWVLGGGDPVGVVADPGSGGAVAAALERYRFRVEAAMEADPGPSVEVWGPAAADVLERAGLPVPEGWLGDGGTVVASLPLGGLPRYLVAGKAADRLAGTGVRPAGTLAADAVRIEAGEPLTGVDVDEGTIPQETGLVPAAVSFTKGCYLGQELVARIDSRGHVNRRLAAVVMAENVIPPPGAVVTAGDVEAGVVTSVAESLTLRAPVGLALLRREAVPDGAVEVSWPGGSARAVVREVPLDDFARS